MPPKRKPKRSTPIVETDPIVAHSSSDIALIDSLANKGASVRGEDLVPSLNSSLEEKQDWTAKQISSLGSRYEAFRENVFILCRDEEYRNWLQSTSQALLAEQWGVSQAYVSKTFGSLQKDLKTEIKNNILALLDKGESIRKVAEITGESKSKIQRIAVSQEDDLSQTIRENKMGQKEDSRARKRAQYEKKAKDELISLLIQRDEIIGRLKNKLSRLDS